jgi:UPF0755 protein
MNRAIIAYAAILFIAVAAGAMYVYRAVYGTPKGRAAAAEPVLFAVQAGESFSSVASRLSKLDLVDHPRAVEAYAWLRGWDRKIKAGTYRLGRNESPRVILERFIGGDILRVTVTIPEGFTHAQIAGAVSSSAAIDSAAFASLIDDEEACRELEVAGGVLEGYLFPDTYLVPWGSTPMDVARMMRARLEEILDANMKTRLEETGLTLHEALTLASIIQAEARLPEEMPLVSAVYHNRLRSGMKLEADPTVAYALGGRKGRLFYKDLEIESPFNTYKHVGLPPGPICAPGKGAIVAALYPDTTCKAVYFVARGDGGHIFSMTLEDHAAAVEALKRARRSSD